MAWLVEQIGGDDLRVFTVLEPGDSPETFQPTDARVTELLQSKVYFYSGVPFERGAWFDAILDSSELLAVDLQAGVELLAPQGSTDPHIWTSPDRLRIQAASVAETLIRVDAGRSDTYRTKLQELDDRLRRLDDEMTIRLQPHRGRSFMVFHPSWAYFADDYDLRQIAIEKAGQAPSDIELTEIQRRAREDGVRVVYVQPQISDRSARMVAEAIGGSVESLDPLAANVIDNLSDFSHRLVAGFEGAAEP